MTGIAIKNVANRNSVTTEAVCVGVIADLKDATLDVQAVDLQELLHIATIYRFAAIKAKNAAKRFSAAEVAEMHRSTTYSGAPPVPQPSSCSGEECRWRETRNPKCT